jgi:hypothetical protein
MVLPHARAVCLRRGCGPGGWRTRYTDRPAAVLTGVVERVTTAAPRPAPAAPHLFVRLRRRPIERALVHRRVVPQQQRAHLRGAAGHVARDAGALASPRAAARHARTHARIPRPHHVCVPVMRRIASRAWRLRWRPAGAAGGRPGRGRWRRPSAAATSGLRCLPHRACRPPARPHCAATHGTHRDPARGAREYSRVPWHKG